VSTPITIMAVGDLIVDERDPERYFAPSAPLLRAADLTIAQIDVPHSRSTEVTAVIAAPPAAPENVAAIADAGIDVVTLASNHIYDAGGQGVADTIEACRAAGLQTVGAGQNIAQAREPLVYEVRGRRVGVLSYTCVGPRSTRATSQKPGAAYVEVITHRQTIAGVPGGRFRTYTFCTPESRAAMEEDIRLLGERVDIVLVGLHKGLAHQWDEIADYEIEISHAAIDAGAHGVLGHHAHVTHGIEFYRGRPIFHNLGNFVTVTRALAISEDNSEERLAWSRERMVRFGFAVDPRMPNYPFHPDSRNTMIGLLRVKADGSLAASFIPCWIDDVGRPVPLARDRDGIKVANHIEMVTRAAGFATEFEWTDGEVSVRPERMSS
jgi:poly-gamma-glutamate capsule biosynthesis protein CapA/YwtB (metallophosphatase superfamily)